MTDVVSMRLWAVRVSSSGVQIEGYRLASADGAALKNWLTTPVIQCISPTVLLTSSGTTYELAGPADAELMLKNFCYPSWFCDAVKNGLPDNWKELADKCWNEVSAAHGDAPQPEEQPQASQRTTAHPRISDVSQRSGILASQQTNRRRSRRMSVAPLVAPILEESIEEPEKKKEEDSMRSSPFKTPRSKNVGADADSQSPPASSDSGEVSKENAENLPPPRRSPRCHASSLAASKSTPSPRAVALQADAMHQPDTTPGMISRVEKKPPTRSSGSGKGNLTEAAGSDGVNIVQIVNVPPSSSDICRLTQWSLLFVDIPPAAALRDKSPFENFQFVIYAFNNDVEWRTSPIVRVGSDGRTVETARGTKYYLVGPLDRYKASIHELPMDLVDAFEDGFPPDWRDRLIHFFNSLAHINDAGPRIEEVREETQENHHEPLDNGDDFESLGEIDDDSHEEKKKSKKLTRVHELQNQEQRSASRRLSSASTSSDVRVSRSGRTLRPPMATWAGERVVYDAHGNPVKVSSATHDVPGVVLTDTDRLADALGVEAPAPPRRSLEGRRRSSIVERERRRTRSRSFASDNSSIVEPDQTRHTNQKRARNVLGLDYTLSDREESEDVSMNNQPQKKRRNNQRVLTSDEDEPVRHKKRTSGSKRTNSKTKKKQQPTRRDRSSSEEENRRRQRSGSRKGKGKKRAASPSDDDDDDGGLSDDDERPCVLKKTKATTSRKTGDKGTLKQEDVEMSETAKRIQAMEEEIRRLKAAEDERLRKKAAAEEEKRREAAEKKRAAEAQRREAAERRKERELEAELKRLMAADMKRQQEEAAEEEKRKKKEEAAERRRQKREAEEAAAQEAKLKADEERKRLAEERKRAQWSQQEINKLKLVLHECGNVSTDVDWEKVASMQRTGRSASECKKTAETKLKWKPRAQTILEEEEPTGSSSAASTPKVTAKKGTAAHHIQVTKATTHYMRTGGTDGTDEFFADCKNDKPNYTIADLDPNDSMINALLDTVPSPSQKPKATKKATTTAAAPRSSQKQLAALRRSPRGQPKSKSIFGAPSSSEEDETVNNTNYTEGHSLIGWSPRETERRKKLVIEAVKADRERKYMKKAGQR